MNAPPRLLHIAGPSKFGGDSVLILEMGRSAMERGFAVDVMAADPIFQEEIRKAGLGLVDCDVIRHEIRPVADLAAVRSLTSLLRDTPYDIVHTHTSKPGVVGRLAATRAHVPAIVHTVHLFGFHEETGPLATAVYVSVERVAARWCDRIVTVSEHLRDRALELGIGRPEQIVAIPNGVPERRARAQRSPSDVRAALGLGDGLMMLSTGRLAEQKGLEYLARAVALLGSDVGPFHVVLAGTGPLRDELTGLVAELGIGDRMHLLGYRDDIGDLLNACDVFVMPSLWEGLSISLLEAMAAAKPVITTSIASNCEVTGNGEAALLVPPKDPAALADAMRRLITDTDERQRLGKVGLDVQRTRYSMERMLTAYNELYDELLARPVSRADTRRGTGAR
jgi:glycosyltransferase involved in cell wall biosynthesis